MYIEFDVGNLCVQHAGTDSSERTAELKPENLWLLSTKLHKRGWVRLARGLKAINALVYSAALPPEAQIQDDIRLWHNGLGVVIHPDTKVGNGVQIAHHVTIGAGSPFKGTPYGVVVEDGVTIATGAVIAPRPGSRLTVGAGSIIGANVVVTKDVPPFTTVVGGPSREIGQRPAGFQTGEGQTPGGSHR